MLIIKMIITDSEGSGSMLCVTWKKHSKDNWKVSDCHDLVIEIVRSSIHELFHTASCGILLMSTSSLLRHGASSIVMLHKAVNFLVLVALLKTMCVDKMLEF